MAIGAAKQTTDWGGGRWVKASDEKVAEEQRRVATSVERGSDEVEK